MGGKEIHDINGLEENEIKLLVTKEISDAEKRLMVYVNDKHDHQKRNFEQAIVNLTNIFTLKQEHSDQMAERQHGESSRRQDTILTSVEKLTSFVEKQDEKVDKINLKIYMAIGGFVVLEAVLKFLPHLLGK